MRKLFMMSLIFVIICMQGMAQIKSQRRIYLWDVTLSMKGSMGKTPDIYNDVVNFLKRELNSLTDENIEIVVLPFQEGILETWKAKADVAGKKYIIEKIESYSNNKVTNTDIVASVRAVQNQVINDDKHNMVFLLTDGKQTGGNQALLALIKNWEEYAKIKDVYALYVMLTPQAVDKELVDAINETGRIEVVQEPGKIDWIDLQPASLIRYNIKDDAGKPAMIPITYKKNMALPQGIKVQVTSANDSIIAINELLEINNQNISLTLNYNYQHLRTRLGESTRIPLLLELQNQQEIKDNTGKIIFIHPSNIEIELINRPEKTLRIHVKK